MPLRIDLPRSKQDISYHFYERSALNLPRLRKSPETGILFPPEDMLAHGETDPASPSCGWENARQGLLFVYPRHPPPPERAIGSRLSPAGLTIFPQRIRSIPPGRDTHMRLALPHIDMSVQPYPTMSCCFIDISFIRYLSLYHVSSMLP